MIDYFDDDLYLYVILLEVLKIYVYTGSNNNKLTAKSVAKYR